MTTQSGWQRVRALVARGFWLWPALLTLALGLYGSSRAGLWRDELATWSAIDRSTPQLFDLLKHVDASSGAYYVFEHYWAQVFGHSLLMLRLPSALAMTGAAVFVALTGRRLFGPRTGLVSALIFAVIPATSRYAQEARSYALVVCAVSLATWLLLRALERPVPLRWLPYAGAVAVAGYLHMVSLVFLAGHALIVVLRRRAHGSLRTIAGFALAAAAGLLPLLPLVLMARRQSGRQLDWLTKPTMQYVVDWFWRGLFDSTAVSLGILALALLPVAWPKRRRPAFEIGMLAALPIGVLWLISQGSTAYFLDRYLLFTLPAWALAAGAGLTALRPRALTALGLVVLVILGLPDQRQLRRPYSREIWDAKAAAAVIAQGYRPGDGLVPVRADMAYLQVGTAIDYYLPSGIRPKQVFALGTAADAQDLLPQDCTDEAACLGGTARLWVATFGTPADPLAGLNPAEQKLLGAYTKVRVTPVHGMVVTLLERRS
ncbi:hypothetical protein GCM10009760_03060 [Kitasatospora kazusensis]|uniref:Glycosyltransferase RgtA/B/C/D-like domain-containing protein n=1 Tax=Kitasatospora kazusensis TaxID=407974 RepID=A0ABN2YS08_9ACTN